MHHAKEKDLFEILPKTNIFVCCVCLNCIRVYKQTFCQVHGIGKCRVENLCVALASDILYCSDGHGKHKNRLYAIPEDLKGKVRQHILSFPSRESHYSRQSNKNRKYLPDGLTIACM